ncbi:MAG: sensor histidine kinase [Treponemataceae bacterium]|nr:sensor histidine kinase [Treponemataceae bacterium]
MKKTFAAVAILFLIPLWAFCAAPSLYDAWDEFAEAARRAERGGSFDGGEYAAALGDLIAYLDALMQSDRFKYIDSQRDNPQRMAVGRSWQDSAAEKNMNTMGNLYGAVKNLRDTAETYWRQFSGEGVSQAERKIRAEQSFAALQSLVVTVARYETEATNATSSLFSMLVIIFSAVAAGIGAAIIVYVRRQKAMADLKQKMKDGQTIVRIQENERNRMYRELHDTVAQDIRATALFSKQFDTLSGVPKEVAELAKKISLLCQQSLTGMYATISDLAPPELDGNFSDALETLCTNHRRLTGIPCKRHIDNGAAELLSKLNADKKLHVYRIVQEALQNAAKHAHPSECSLIVNATDEKISLFVTDDGTGFSLGTAKARRTFGISGMKSRAELVGAQLSINSSEEGGTEVKLEIPIRLIPGMGGGKR